MQSITHIIFDPAAEENLEAAIELDEKLAGPVIVFEDDLSVGPLDATPSRIRFQRQQLLQDEDAQTVTAADQLKLHQLKKQLEEDEELHLWLWAAQNARDVCAYFWLMEPLMPFQGRIHILYLNNLPFLNEKGGIFYPVCLHEILPKELVKAQKLARPVSPAEFEIDSEDWRRLQAGDDTVRILEGGKKISGKSADAFDQQLLNHCKSANYAKSSRIANIVKDKYFPYLDSSFLEWRLRELILQGKLSAKENVKDAEVQLISGN